MHAAWRSMLFRVAAVLLGLPPFGLIEVALRMFGLGRSEWHHDPFVGFSETRPLFVRNDAQDRFELAPSKRVHFNLESFAVQNSRASSAFSAAANQRCRATRGRRRPRSRLGWRSSLNAADPSREWDVVNCGGVSYARYRMVPISAHERPMDCGTAFVIGPANFGVRRFIAAFHAFCGLFKSPKNLPTLSATEAKGVRE